MVGLLVAGALMVVPAFAVGASPSPPKSPDEAFGDADSPGAKQLAKRLREAQKSLEQRRERLASPEARAERRRSRRAFRAHSRGEAIALAKKEQPELLTTPIWEPLRLGSKERVARYYGDHGAQVVDEDGRRRVVDSVLPIRSEVGDGEPKRADLSLREEGDALVPGNPLVKTKIAKDVHDGVRLGDSVTVKLEGGADSTATETGDRAFFPDALTDSDLTVMPTPRGVQFALQVRSEDAPEVATFDVGMPDGAELRLRPRKQEKGDKVEGEPGSVEVVKDEKVLAVIRAPVGWDADQQPVKTRYEVDGDNLRLEFLHHSADVRYPLVVDPQVDRFRILENGDLSPSGLPGYVIGQAGGDYAAWSYNRAGYGSENYSRHPIQPATTQEMNTPLVVGSAGYRGYGWLSYGQWYWASPRSSWVQRADYVSVSLQTISATGGADPYAQCTIQGVYSWTQQNWEPGVVTQPASTPPYYALANPSSTPWAYCAAYGGTKARTVQSHWPTPGNIAVFRLTALTDENHPLTNGWYTQMDGAAVTLEDGQAPTITSAGVNVTPTGPSYGGWVKSGSASASVGARDAAPGAADSQGGLGIWKTELSVPGHSPMAAGAACHLRLTRCPLSSPFSFNFTTAGMPEGVNAITGATYDATNKPTNFTAGHVKIDRSPPSTSIQGVDDGQTLENEQYPIVASATDTHSGVKQVTLKFDDDPKGTTTNCPAPPQACRVEWTLDASDPNLTEGPHTLKVEATDQLDQPAPTVTKTVHIQRSGAADTAAPTATARTEPPGRWHKNGDDVTAIVTGDDGSGTGIKTFGLRYPGTAPQESFSRDCGGATPSSTPPRCQAQDSHTFSPAVDGDKFPAEGRTQVSGRVIDAAGNESSWVDAEVRIDRSGPSLETSGTLHNQRNLILFGGSYDLNIIARDGSAAAPDQERSGVKQIRVLVKKDAPGEDFVEKFATPSQTCPASNCQASGSWTLDTDDYDEGARYIVRVAATDQLGHEGADTFSVWIGPSLDPESLFVEDRNGLEEFWNYDTTETGAGTRANVNLQTGNLVWHSVPIVNPGRGLSTVANVTYNSQETKEEALLPESPIADALDLGQYNQVGRGFSLGLSGLTRVNDHLDLRQLALGRIRLTDVDGTRHSFTSSDGCRTFTSPSGVYLRLRRFSPGKLGVEPGCALLSGGQVDDANKAWAATRPDGVTHFFDARGYQTSIEDRNDNKLTFAYEYRDLDGAVCTPTDGGSVLPNSPVCAQRLTSVTDAEDQPLTLSYYPDNILDGNTRGGLIKDITDHAGRVTHFEYDDRGYLTKMTQAVGTTAERSFGFAYDGAATQLLTRRTLNEITDPRGMATEATGDGVTRLTYASNGLPDLNGVGDGLIYRKRVSGLTNRRNSARTFTYSQGTEDGETRDAAAVTDALQRQWLHSMDTRGRPRKLTDPKAVVTKLDWQDDVNAPSKLTEAAGTGEESVTDMAYNANGQLTEQTTHPEPGTASKDRKRVLTYRSSAGKHISGAAGVDDASGTFVSDLTAINNPKAGTGWTFGVDDRGNVTSRTDAKGNMAETAYDSAGRIKSEKDEQGHITRYTDFDTTGQPKVMIDPRSADAGSSDNEHRWIYSYDAVGNVRTVTDPRGAKTGGADDVRTDFTTFLNYDALDRLGQESMPKDTAGDTADQRIIRSKVYDANDNVKTSTDGENKTTGIDYTPMDLPETVSAPGSNGPEVTRYGYNALDQLTSKTDPKGDATSAAFKTEFELDELGRRVAEVRNDPAATGTNPKKLITSYSYDRRANVTGVIDAKRNNGRTAQQAITAVATDANRRSTYMYNRDDELIDQVERPLAADGALVKPIHTTFEYDANGNRIAVSSPRKDADNTDVTSSTSWLTKSDFDHRDQLTDITNPKGERTHLTRREDGKVVAKTTPRGVEEEGEPSQPIAPGSSIKAYKYFTTRYGYNRNGDLDSRSVPFAPNQYGRTDEDLQAWKVTYERDEVGNPTTITDARGNFFENTFYDTGDIRTTERPSWWKLDSGEQQIESPDAGVRFRGQAASDPELATDGPKLVENEERSSNAQQTEETPEMPDSQSSGNFGAVDPESMPGLLPAAGSTTFSYDGEMRLTDAEDIEGAKRSLTYDAAGRIRSKSWPFKTDSRIENTFDYDANGNLTRQTDGENKITEFAYDGYDRRVQETAPAARNAPAASENGTEVTNFGYDPNGNLTSRDTAGTTPAFTFTYDSLDRLITESNPASEMWRYRNDVAGNRVLERSPRGENDPVTGASIYDTKLRYDAADRLDKSTDGWNKATDFSYDADGNRTRVQAPGAAEEPGGAEQARGSATEYDGRGLPWKIDTGQAGTKRRTIKEFDPNGNLRRIVNPKGLTDEREPAHTDNGVSSGDNLRDATKHATVRTYDDNDLVSQEFLPWDDDGADQRRLTQKWSRDSRGRVESAFSPYELGSTEVPQRSYTYYHTDWVASSTDEEEHNPALPNPPVGKALIRYDYDKRGNQTQWKSAHANTGPKGREINRAFYPNGLLKSRTAEKLNDAGERDSRTKRAYRYFYNPNRSLVQMDDDNPARGDNRDVLEPGDTRSTKITRDNAERELAVDETWSTGRDTVYEYDPNGNVYTRRTDGRGTTPTNYGSIPGARNEYKKTIFGYDRLDHETLSKNVQQLAPERRVETEYWSSGQVKQRRLLKAAAAAGDVVETRFYNHQGEPSQTVRKKANASTPRKDQSYEYDLNGNRTKDERGDHVFNPRDQLVKWTRGSKQAKPGTTVDYDLTETGAIKKKTDSGLPGSGADQEIRYDYVGTRLDKVVDKDTTQKYSYDDFGSVTRIKSTLNDPEGTQFPPASPLPSGLPPACEGQLTGLDSGETAYCFDEFERMVAARGPGLDKETAVYDYDGFDRRDSKVARTASGTPKRRDYTYVGTSRMLSREQSPEGKPMFYDYSSTGEREGQAKANAGLTAAATYRTFAVDANGSVEELEETNGDPTPDSKYVYDPYGEREAPASSNDDSDLSETAQENPFRFEGFYFDSGVKTYDMQARQYRSDTGRFLSGDKYEAAGADLNLQADPLTQNRYAFAGGNPVNNVEFDGHDPHAIQDSCERNGGVKCGERSAGSTEAVAEDKPEGNPYTRSGLTRRGQSGPPRPGNGFVQRAAPTRIRVVADAGRHGLTTMQPLPRNSNGVRPNPCPTAGSCRGQAPNYSGTVSEPGDAFDFISSVWPFGGTEVKGAQAAAAGGPKVLEAVGGLLRRIVGRDSGRAGASALARRGTLRANLAKLHGPLKEGYEAHHLVAVGDPRAAGARRILGRFGIDPNSAVNGVALPGRGSGRVPGETYHPSMHTNPYYDAVEQRLAGATTRREATQALGTVRRDIRAGTFP